MMRINFILLFEITFLSSLFALSLQGLITEEWEEFKFLHGKTYLNDMEESFRMKFYLENRRRIAFHNSRKNVTFKLAMNKYGDLLTHEFNKQLNGYKPIVREKNNKPQKATFMKPAFFTAPAEIDWRNEGYVTGVKDQGDCGSCWAFSATGGIEGQQMRKNSKLISLSEQNLIDCSSGNEGCDGGNIDYAFVYVKFNKGIDTEISYPYEATDYTQCRYNKSNSAAIVAGYVDIPKGDEKKLMEAVSSVGPVCIAIDASLETFHLYSTGVYVDPNCRNDEMHLNHGVLIVGYGSENGMDYWLVKNSWGESWGNKGYIKMGRNMKNQCGVATAASYPLV